MRAVRSVAGPAGLVPAVFLALLLALGGVLASATSAAAHDKLESTTPKRGATLARPPATVMLTFNQPVFKLGSRIRVVGPAGDVAVGQPTFAGEVVRQPIRPDAPAGTYTVEWQVTSSDGHPIAGTWTFSAQDAGVAATTAPAAPPTPSATSATTPEPTVGSATAPDEDGGSSTGLVVGVTAGAAAGLLAAAGAVAWASRRRRC
jgi:methionine-rich copper-binding protein CopC